MKIYYNHRLLTPVDLFKKFNQENNVDLSFAKTAHLSNKTYKGDEYANGKFLWWNVFSKYGSNWNWVHGIPTGLFGRNIYLLL